MGRVPSLRSDRYIWLQVDLATQPLLFPSPIAVVANYF